MADWLSDTAFAGWACAPLAGDASSRRYTRLTGPDGETAMLMEDPSGEAARIRFTRIADHLRSLGLCAPQTHAARPGSGDAVLSDLGALTLATHLERAPKDETSAYIAVTDLLIALHRHAAPAWLEPLTPERGAEMLAPLASHYAPGFDLTEPQEALHRALETFGIGPAVLAHRDFHAENLIWRADQTGLDRIGLLDFQDAVAAPPAYDLASLTRDCRRDLAPGVACAITDHYAAATGTDRKGLARAIAVWAVQRNLRILGVFARLAADRGKPGYLDLLPRVWRHIQADLAHPDLGDLAQSLRALPAPENRP